MKQISDFLERFQKIAVKGSEGKKAVIEVLNAVGIRISEETPVTIRGTIVQVKLSPAQKAELHLKQKKIIELLKQNPLTSKIEKVY